MGASLTFLEKPNTEIEYMNGENTDLKTKFVAAEMQGWRLNQVRLLSKLISMLIGRRPHLKLELRQTASTLCSV